MFKNILTSRVMFSWERLFYYKNFSVILSIPRLFANIQEKKLRQSGLKFFFSSLSSQAMQACAFPAVTFTWCRAHGWSY